MLSIGLSDQEDSEHEVRQPSGKPSFLCGFARDLSVSSLLVGGEITIARSRIIFLLSCDIVPVLGFVTICLSAAFTSIGTLPATLPPAPEQLPLRVLPISGTVCLLPLVRGLGLLCDLLAGYRLALVSVERSTGS